MTVAPIAPAGVPLNRLVNMETDVSHADLMQSAAASLSKEGITVEGIMVLWRALSRLIADSLTNGGRGVRVEGLGTFTLDVNAKPVFVMATEFAATHALRDFTTSAAKTLNPATSNGKLNIARVAQSAEMERPIAETAVATVLKHLGRYLKERKSVSLSFHPMAEFACIPRDSAAMKFLPSFVSEVEATHKASTKRAIGAAGAVARPTARTKELQQKLQTQMADTRRPSGAGGERRRSGGLRASDLKAMSRGGSAHATELPFQSRTATNSTLASRAGHHGRPRRRPETPVPSYASSEVPSYHTPRGGSSVGGWMDNHQSQHQQRGGVRGGIRGGDARSVASSALGGAEKCAAVERVKAKCIERGGHNGIHAMARVLKIMDDNGDGKLDRSELSWGLKDYGIVLKPNELEAVFQYFDRDHNGFITFDEFLQGLRGPMSQRRLDLIRQAFDILDTTGDGVVTVDDIKNTYDCSWHPEVKSGNKAEAQVLAEFLRQWDGNKDGTITPQEFEEYYASVSASIDKDDAFELMMRNAWHISGGEGWCENSANKRMLVRGANGTENVREIKQDLRIKRGDQDAARRELMKQGDAHSTDGIEAYGSLDTTSPAQRQRPRTATHQQRGRQDHNMNENARGTQYRNTQNGQAQSPPSPYGNRAGDVNLQRPAGAGNDVRGRDRGSRDQKAYDSKNRRTSMEGIFGNVDEEDGMQRRDDMGDFCAPPRRQHRERSEKIPAAGGGVSKRAWPSQDLKSGENGDDLAALRSILYDPPCNLETLIGRLQASKLSEAPTAAIAAVSARLLTLQPSLGKRRAELLAQSCAFGAKEIDITHLHKELAQRFGRARAGESGEPLNTTGGGSGGAAIERVRRKLLEGGGGGARALTRAVKRMDEDGDNKLSKAELKLWAEAAGVMLNLKELDDVFTFFDRDRSGSISLEELLVGLRPEMPARRMKLVREAYSILDSNGDGRVTVEDLADAYDCSQHPEVKNGSKTVAQVLRTFINQWDSGDKDGIVTPSEFEEYYSSVSANIDGDDYFELMMRNAWHISGGEGWCGNSANKRMLVRGKNGSENVREIKKDLRLKRGDNSGARKELMRQGDARSTDGIEAYGSFDNTQPARRERHGAIRGAEKQNGFAPQRRGSQDMADLLGNRPMSRKGVRA